MKRPRSAPVRAPSWFESDRALVWVALGVVALCLVAFRRVVGFEFVGFDDYQYVVQNASLRDGLTFAGMREAFLPRFFNWIPLTELSYHVDYALYGLEPAGYHVTNLLLHTLSAVVLLLALSRMTGSVWRSGFVAAVFAVHPLHVESVAWVSERKDVLSGLFWMLTLYTYTRYREAPGSRRFYAAAIACFGLGLLAKPIVVTLPFVLLLLDYWPLGRFSGAADTSTEWRRALLEKLPMFALAGASSAVTFYIQRASGTVSDLVQLPFSLRVENALRSIVDYLHDAVWPTGLAAFYPHPLDSLGYGELAAAILLLVGISAVAYRFGRARGYLPVGWLWFLGTLVPVIGLVQVGMQARADRYMYLPLIGLSIPIVWGAAELADRMSVPKAARAAVASVVLVALVVATGQQAETWRNTHALYERALAVTANNYLAHKAMGSELLNQGRVSEATEHFQRASRLAPDWLPPQLGLADVAVQSGRIEHALGLYERAIRHSPADPSAVGRYGLALGLAGRYAEARIYLMQALTAQRGNAGLHRAMVDVEAALGNVPSALRHGREALRLQPDYTDAANSLAWLLATTSDPTARDAKEAIRLVESAALASNETWLLDTLAAAYAADGRFDDAVRIAKRAARSAEQQGRLNEAREIRQRLIEYGMHRPHVETRKPDQG